MDCLVLIFSVICFLPVDGANFIVFGIQLEDLKHNVAVSNPKSRKTPNKINIFVYGDSPVDNLRKRGDNFSKFKMSERDVNKILSGHKVEDYLSPDEIRELKVKELIDFIQTHHMSAEYFYDEMLRIINQREVRDDLRNMVTYFEENPHLKKYIFKAFENIKSLKKQKPDIWTQKTNNLAASIDAGWYI